MRQSTTGVFIAVFVAQVYAAPQFITFKEGKLGVNFGGYHAAVGLGGLAGGTGAGGGLFAEAGTPYGQAARAGLGGATDANGGSSGGLYAGATAGGNVKASAGLAGGVTAEKAAGTGFASAQAGDRIASSGLGGESSVEGASGFSFSGGNSFGFMKNVEVKPVIKTVEVQPVVKTVEVVHPINTIEEVKPVFKTEVKLDSSNEVNPLPLNTAAKTETQVNVEALATPVVVKEVYVAPAPTKVVQKEFVRYKPHRHHLRKTAYIGGYIGGGGDFVPPPPPSAVIYKTVQPAIQKRIDVGVQSDVNAGGVASFDAGGSGGGQYSYTKQVAVQRNPTFFADIFNIPISTLRAVGNFLGNAAGGTNISVQKSASVHADANSESSVHAPLSTSSSVASETQLSVQTPPVSKFIDDIFAIPINTLGAVNKFLENNVPARKNVQVGPDGVAVPTKVRLGPHARRKANKQVVILAEKSDEGDTIKIVDQPKP